MINPPSERRTWILAAFREEIQDSYPKDLHKDGKRLCDNSWQTISQVARDRNIAIEKQAQRKNQCCTTLAAIHAGYVTKIRPRVLKKFKAAKKSRAYAFPAGEVRASMPTSRKKNVAQRSVQRSASPLQSKTVSPSSTTGPGWPTT
jgi:hypothetical protein